ncbi:MAG TPA: CAP domain-containing protein [Abditibacteriaceae bacterium]|nr:CAP domain-containing protein [Abditibacteriaceae bacterium]
MRPLCLLVLLVLTRPGMADPVDDPVDDMPIPPEALETVIDSTPEVYQPQAAAVLLRYQTALDQIVQGNLREARVLLEEGIRRYGDEPNLNLLLAFLLEREGRGAEAHRRLTAVAGESSVAAAYAGQATHAAPTVAVKAAATPTPARLPQPDVRLARLERAMARLVNKERAQLGLSPLTYDSTLAAVARAHSAEMRDHNYFAHESPTDALRAPLDRYRAVFRASPAIVAENVFRAWGDRHRLSAADVQEAHTSLMQSPSHRSNIVEPRVTRIGIGILANANGDIWVTQMFVRPR